MLHVGSISASGPGGAWRGRSRGSNLIPGPCSWPPANVRATRRNHSLITQELLTPRIGTTQEIAFQGISWSNANFWHMGIM